MFFCVLKVGGSSFRDDIWSRTADQKGQLEQEWKTHLDVFLVCLEGERELIQRRHLEQDGRSERTIGTGAEDTFKCVFCVLRVGGSSFTPLENCLGVVRCCVGCWLLVGSGWFLFPVVVYLVGLCCCFVLVVGSLFSKRNASGVDTA